MKRKNLRKIVPALVVCAVIYLVFLAGYLTGKQVPITSLSSGRIVNTESGKPSKVDFSLFWEAWNRVVEKSAGNPDAKKMVDGAISGMVSSLGDPYTVYFSEDDNKRFKEDISGEFGGIGVEIVQKNNLPTVVAPLPDSPAEKTGLKANDIIAEVDGTKTTDMSFNETIDKIRGEKGTKVKLKVVREGASDPLSFEVQRDTITVKSVQWDLKNVDGKKFEYVKIRQFGDDTDQLFGEAVSDIQKNKPDGVVVDLRNNPGGYLESAIDLSSYFVDGVVVSEKGKDGKSKEYKATHSASLKNYKLTVLVNGGSASASEIFSGAMQDRGAGKLIGEKTFGKGSVQELVEMSDGSAVKVTVANWYTPNGRQITGQGIEPDVKVTDDEKTKDDEQLNRAYDYLKNGK